MPTKKPECVVTDCPAQYRRSGCGYLVTGTPCRHPQWRDEWKKENQKHEEVQQCSDLD